MDLLSVLVKTLTSSSSIASLVGKTGASSDQLTKLITAAVPTLLKALTKNVSTADGAASLVSALTAHTSTRSMTEQVAEADAEDGAKIVKHILGDDEDSVVEKLVGESGLNTDQVTQTLSNIAPGLMSTLSAATGAIAGGSSSNGGFDLSSVMSMLGGADLGEAAEQVQESAGGLLGSLFGGSDSGSGIGSLLGSLFGGKDDDKEDESALNGTALLSTLASLMK